ncbi:hypothetical protein KGM_213199 [Danaus plexippus plexippus]|uniref:Uncharacterized protein n=1 Tax=Danaus plexippus plexippus TaxID=278856 RepID=A0A212FAX9_DANPL|nr:hypothetical protein KGM_213199 [Danaus plexippus plexippus]
MNAEPQSGTGCVRGSTSPGVAATSSLFVMFAKRTTYHKSPASLQAVTRHPSPGDCPVTRKGNAGSSSGVSRRARSEKLASKEAAVFEVFRCVPTTGRSPVMCGDGGGVTTSGLGRLTPGLDNTMF